MKQDTDSNRPTQPKTLSLKELNKVLIKHYKLHEGIYDVSVEFNIGVGPIGPTKDNLCPGAFIGVNGIGLVKVDQPGGSTVDAGEFNPKRKKIS